MRTSDISELIAFATVAEHRSFRRASERLGLSPSTLSHSLRSLEDRLGVRLLNRTTRSVGLTDAGAALLVQLRPALGQIESALVGIHEFSTEPRGTVRLNVPRLAADMLLGKRLGEFVGTFPGVVLEVAIDDRFVDIVGAGYDAGVRLGESIDQDMVAVRLCPPLRNIVVGSPRYFANNPLPIACPEDLLGHRCIGYRASGTRRLYKWEFVHGDRRVDIQPQGPLVLDDHGLLVQAALEGAGLGYVIESSVQEELANGSLVRVLDAWCRPFDGFFLYYPSHRRISAALRACIDFLREPVSDRALAGPLHRRSSKAEENK